MFKKTTTILISLFLSIGLSAQNKGKEMAEKFFKNIQESKSIEMAFNFSLVNEALDINDSQEGKLLLSGNKFQLHIMGSEIYCDGESIWTYTGQTNEISITSAEESGFFNPGELFDLYKDDYEVKQLPSDKGYISLEIIPNDDDNFKRITVRIEEKSMALKEANYFGIDDNKYIIKATSFKKNPIVKPSDFVLKASKYPDAEVYDMR